MSILSYVISVVILGALVALLTNGIMQGLKQIPFVNRMSPVLKYLLMLLIAGGCAVVVQDGAKEIVQTSFFLIWLCSVAAAQLGYDKIIKNKIEELGHENAIKSNNAIVK